MKFRILVLLSVLLPFLVSAEEKPSAFRSLNADDGLTPVSYTHLQQVRPAHLSAE